MAQVLFFRKGDDVTKLGKCVNLLSPNTSSPWSQAKAAPAPIRTRLITDKAPSSTLSPSAKKTTYLIKAMPCFKTTKKKTGQVPQRKRGEPKGF